MILFHLVWQANMKNSGKVTLFNLNGTKPSKQTLQKQVL